MSSRPIRIVLDVAPRLLHDIIEGALTVEHDMRLLDIGGERDLSAAVKRCEADVVIVGDQPRMSTPSHHHLLVDNPSLKIFVVTDDGRTATLVEVRSLPVAEMSPRGLVAAIRAAMR